MQTDLNTHETPQWWLALFRQAATGWSAPTPVGSTFSQTVVLIIQHRLKNPAIVAKHQLSTDPEVVGEELMNFNRLRLGIPKPKAKAPTFFAQSRNLAGDVAGEIRRAAQGTAVVLDWLQSGGQPVAQELANRRAEICVACPKQVDGSWYTVTPAELIKAALEARKDLKLETPSDSQLKSCGVCRCLLKLKVWTPLSFILQRTKPEIMAEFPKENCWIARKDQ